MNREGHKFLGFFGVFFWGGWWFEVDKFYIKKYTGKKKRLHVYDLTGERMLKSLNKFLTSNYTKCKPWGQRRATIGCKGGFCSATWVSCR